MEPTNEVTRLMDTLGREPHLDLAAEIAKDQRGSAACALAGNDARDTPRVAPVQATAEQSESHQLADHARSLERRLTEAQSSLDRCDDARIKAEAQAADANKYRQIAEEAAVKAYKDGLASAKADALERAAENLDACAHLVESDETHRDGYDKYGYADFLRGSANAIRALKGTPCAPSDSVMERLADLEHQQWIAWAGTLMEREILSEARITRWRKLMVPYADLPEDAKEQDRIWARKTLALSRQPDPSMVMVQVWDKGRQTGPAEGEYGEPGFRCKDQHEIPPSIEALPLAFKFLMPSNDK